MSVASSTGIGVSAASAASAASTPIDQHRGMDSALEFAELMGHGPRADGMSGFCTVIVRGKPRAAAGKRDSTPVPRRRPA
jgi:hypothetical protein